MKSKIAKSKTLYSSFTFEMKSKIAKSKTLGRGYSYFYWDFLRMCYFFSEFFINLNPSNATKIPNTNIPKEIPVKTKFP